MFSMADEWFSLLLLLQNTKNLTDMKINLPRLNCKYAYNTEKTWLPSNKLEDYQRQLQCISAISSDFNHCPLRYTVKLVSSYYNFRSWTNLQSHIDTLVCIIWFSYQNWRFLLKTILKPFSFQLAGFIYLFFFISMLLYVWSNSLKMFSMGYNWDVID